MTLETTQAVPLTQWEDGSIRVKDTRLLVDMIIYAHRRGECPEEIFQSFPSDYYTVADIYAVIAYYLANEEKLDRYVAQREREAEEIRNRIESRPGYKERGEELRAKLRERWEARKSR